MARRDTFASPSLVLFLALFASQAGVLVLSPILSEVAEDFGVSIAAAGQLRIFAAPLAAVVALLAGRALTRFSPRALLGAGSALLAVGSVASAAAPTFALLALAQVPMWAGIATLLAAGVAGAAAWSLPERRTRVVAHALAGPPAAWIAGMPLIGVVAEVHWRLAFLALPLPAALLAGLAVAARPPDVALAGRGTSLRGLLGLSLGRRWALGELFANAAWAGTLVYSGALLTEEYGLSTSATGFALGGVAIAYLLGNQRAGRTLQEDARSVMLTCSVGAAVAVALTWGFTPGVAVTLAFFSLAAADDVDEDGGRNGLRVHDRRRPRPRGRRRAGGHDADRLPRRLAPRRRGDRGRGLRRARRRRRRALPRLDAAVRLDRPRAQAGRRRARGRRLMG